MLKLPHIFSSDALFLQNAALTLSGITDSAGDVRAELSDSAGQCFSSSKTVADASGAFSLTLSTPAASLSAWTITVSTDEDYFVMRNVLFGELWLASGQSNMELENSKQPDAASFFEALHDCVIRVYHVYNIDGGSAGLFPYEPDPMTFGEWFSITAQSSLEKISAVGTAFSKEIYDWLHTSDRTVPVGFVNACWGGTGIRSWIPRAAIDADTALCARLRDAGFYTDPAKWNSFGRNNAQQLSCQYNLKIHGLIGVKFRGILWYQGEFESWDEPYLHLYRDCLYLLHRTFRSLFSADECFPMLCVLIYPFPCTDEGDCYIGYVNQNFVDASQEHPESFYCMPIYDLPPVWEFPVNHPIHPLHKYPVGLRLARLAETAVYGRQGQKNPAVLDRFERLEGRLLLHFAVPGQPGALSLYGGIRIGADFCPDIPGYTAKNRHPIGLYICGASGTYVPAVCDIISHDTVAVSHPGIAQPLHAAYAYSSMEEGCNLYAGSYPLAPFCTDDRRWDPDNSGALIRIEGKPWCNPTRSAVWTTEERHGLLDVFYRPVWKPSVGCEVVHDRAFTLESGSIRIARSVIPDEPLQKTAHIGASVEAHLYHRLDLQNYTALRLRMFGGTHAELSLVLTARTPSGTLQNTALPTRRTAELHHGWAEYEILLDGIGEDEILCIEFSAEMMDTYYHFINLEGFVLVPR